MNVIYLLLLVAAFVCFLIAAFGNTAVDAARRGQIRFLGLGLALWVAVPALQHLLALD